MKWVLSSRVWIFTAFLFTIVCTGCRSVPITGRHQLNFMSQSDEMQLGLSSFDQLKQQTPIDNDPNDNALVKKVGERIAAIAGKDMPNAQWEFVVFQSDEANAFCLPGGKVGVYSGILPITKDEAGLATVLGHEIAHAVARHGGERMSQAKAIAVGEQVVGTATENSDPRLKSAALLAYGVTSKVGVELPFSRAQESEADHIGLIYMARAGYDPEQAVVFWQRFAEFNQQKGGKGYAFLQTHPTDETRIAQLKQWLPEAKGQYHAESSQTKFAGNITATALLFGRLFSGEP
jgi:metalloendopeptidase OMA1, mitochondrial